MDGEAAGLMQGWALMAQKQYGLADSHAQTVAAKFPRSFALVVLAIEAGVAASGGEAGLDRYEAWLGQRTVEEPALLRIVATGMLKTEARAESSARADALRLLAREGIQISDLGGVAGPPPARVLASAGNDEAISQVMQELRAGTTNKVAAIEALASSGSPRAPTAIAAELADPKPEVRGAAADALGRMQARGAQDRLKLLLKDEISFVRVRAAAALMNLNDTSGLPLLKELLVSEAPASRLIGAEALASSPDASWMETVRELTKGGEPTVRLAAARLISPHDPALARSVVEALSADSNPAVRELAARTLAESSAADLKTLRRLLRSDDPSTRVKAAGSILSVTR
jgi:HEAT repeat protein